MKFYIATDHAAFRIKDSVKEIVESLDATIVDLGPDCDDRVDYPDFAHKLCSSVYNALNI